MLNLNTADLSVYHNGEVECLALCHLARLHASQVRWGTEGGGVGILIMCHNGKVKRLGLVLCTHARVHASQVGGQVFAFGGPANLSGYRGGLCQATGSSGLPLCVS